MFKNVASQKLMVFAFDATTNLPKTGDAANLTAYVSKDFGAVTVLTDTSAAEMDATNAKGYYTFDLTQGETNANYLLFSCKSSTANIVVVGVPAGVFTDPPNYSTLSIDSSGRALSDVDTIKTNPVVNAGTVTFPTTATLASTTNITAATGIDVTKWLGGACPAVNTTGVPLVDTKYITGTLQTAKDVGSINLSSGKVLVQGTIDQFDDVFSAAGKLAAIADAAVTAAVIADGAIDNATFAADVGSTAIATNVIGIAAKKGVVDAINVDTYAEPAQGTPPATATIVQRLQYLYKNWRNKKTQTATQWSLLNDDAATVDHKSTVADDGTTASKGEIATGP